MAERSGRSRLARRAAQAQAPPATPRTAARAARSTRGRVKVESEAEDDEDDDMQGGGGGGAGEHEEEDEDAEGEKDEAAMVAEGPAAGPSRTRNSSTRKRMTAASARTTGRSRQKAAPRAVSEDVDEGDTGRAEDEADDDDLSEEEVVVKPKRTRTRKSVSYREVPVEEVEEEPVAEDDDDDDEGEEDAEGEDDEGDEGEQAAPAASPSTPARRSRAANRESATPAKVVEKIGSGRGGFSVKGAAAAAARARWAKVRAEKAERGDDSDDGGDRRKSRGAAKRESKAAVENVAIDTIMNIKGTDYTVGDDELILPDDPKGDAKIDVNGKLLGGREYRLVTFTSAARRNPDRIYALTIDAARACGYTDSLAFLRRCPQVIKLACNAEERQMLIDIGRITGNLKHRMVTMVTMRNVYKLMGARVVKNGKWVTDDYYEDEALAKCPEQGFTPYAPALEDDIIANALSHMAPQGRPPANPNAAHHDSSMAVSGAVGSRSAVTLTPFYTLGGPTTQFAGNGADPWSEAGWGNKRAKLRTWGVTEEDWMFRTAEECRRIDGMLKELRADRLETLEGRDAESWAHFKWQATDAAQEATSDAETGDDGLKPPVMERKPSGLSQEITAKEEDGDVVMNGADAVSQNGKADGELAAAQSRKLPAGAQAGGSIVVQTAEEDEASAAKYSYGLGSIQPGVVKAVYEPHTHMPHVPLYTQPTRASTTKASAYPIVASQSDAQHRNFVQSTISGQAATGLASVEFVLESSTPASATAKPTTSDTEDEIMHLPTWHTWDAVLTQARTASSQDVRRKRLQEVLDAEEWERQARAKRTAQMA